MARPVIGITTSTHVVEEAYEVQMTGRRTIDAVARVSDCLPLLIPGIPESQDIGDLLETLDGVVLTGGRANVHPRYYGQELTEAHGTMDEGRDEVVLPLIRAAVDTGIPVLGLCRGIQEMNVAFGGTLHPEVGDLPGRHRHRMPKGCKDPEIIFKLREKVRLRSGGVLSNLLGTDRIETNSLHGQAVDRPGERVVLEGWAEDGTVEAISIAGCAGYAIGVQWHAEYEAHADPVSSRLFAALGDAARTHQRRKSSRAA